MGRQEEIKPLGHFEQYDSFPSTSLQLHFFNDNELPYCVSNLKTRTADLSQDECQAGHHRCFLAIGKCQKLPQKIVVHLPYDSIYSSH